MDGHAVIIADVEGRIVDWNDGAGRMFGHLASEAVGESLDLVVPEQLRQAHWEGFRRAMINPEIKDLAADLPVRCADGRIRHFAGRLLVLSDALGAAVGAMAIYTDQGSTGVRPFG